MQTRKPLPQKSQRRAMPSRPHVQNANPVMVTIVAIAVVVVLVAGYLLQYKVFPNGLFSNGASQGGDPVAEIAPITSVRINEIMTSNGSAWSDERGKFGDWVEITNTSSTETVDLTGWILADTANALNGHLKSH